MSLLLRHLDAIRGAQLCVMLGSEDLHGGGHGPTESIRALLSDGVSRDCRELLVWLADTCSPPAADSVLAALENLGVRLLDLQNDVTELNIDAVAEVDYPDEQFWLHVDSIEERWLCIREQADAAHATLSNLASRTHSSTRAGESHGNTKGS